MNIKSILLEATEYVDGASLAKAILRGQIAGISKKFFNGEEPDTEALDKFLKVVKTNFDKPLQNRTIVLLLNKAKSINNLKHIDNQIIDATKSYFDNVNKEEAKKPEVKKLFDKFEEVDLIDSFNQEFENKINDLFADSAEMKSNDEYEVIYPEDSNGWEVAIPKTFAAAKYLSSIKGLGKAFWCTSAHAYHFKRYTKNNNKLYIIRNVKNNVLYQMDWGYQYDNYAEPSFQDFQNEPITIKEALSVIPSKVLSVIKDKDGNSVRDFLKKAEDFSDVKNFITKDWSYEKLSEQQFNIICAEYNVEYFSFGKELAQNFLMKKADKDDNYGLNFFLVKNNKFNKMFLFVSPRSYIIDSRTKLAMFELAKDENGHKKAIKINKDDFLKNKIFKNIKDKFFNKKELEKPDYTNYSVKNTRIYLIRNTAAFTKVLPNNIYNLLFKYKQQKKDNFNNYYESRWRAINNLFEHETKFPILYIEKNTPQKECLIIFLKDFKEEKIKNIIIYSSEIYFLDKNGTYHCLENYKLLDFMKKNFSGYYKMLSAYFTDRKRYERERGQRKNEVFFIPLEYEGKKYYYLNSAIKIKEFYRRYKNKYKFEIIDGNNGKKLLIFNSLMVVENNEVKVVNINNLNKEEQQAIKNYFNIIDTSYFNRLYIIDIDNFNEKDSEKNYKDFKEYNKKVLNDLKTKIKDEE